MGQGTYTDEIHTAQGIVADGVRRDAAARFYLDMSAAGLLPLADKGDRPARALHTEIVQHDTVGYARCQRLAYLVLAACLNLDTQVFVLRLAVSACAGERRRDAACKVHMIVLEQYHVEQPDTVVHSAADAHCFFLQIAQPRRGFARVKHMAARAVKEALVAVRRRGDARHTLHDIQHGALYLQERQFFAVHTERDVPRFDRRTVLQEYLHAAGRVETVDNLAGDGNACQYPFLFDNELAAARSVGGNTGQRSVVAVAYILLEPNIYQLS